MPAATPTPAESTSAVSSKRESSPALSALKDIKLGATIDGYYAYNFNKPQSSSGIPSGYGSAPIDQNTYLAPNNYNDQITLNFAELKIWQETRPVGFRVDLGFGPWADALSGNNNILNVSDSGSRYLMQAYLAYKFDCGLVAQAGKFNSDMGFETNEPMANWNYSMSLTSRYFLPYWHTGVRLSMPVGGAVKLVGYISNGINTFYTTSGSKTYGLQAKVDFFSQLSFVANWLTGVQPVLKGDPIAGTPVYAGPDDNRNTYEGTLIFKFADAVSLVADYVLAAEKVMSQAAQQSYALTFFAKWKVAEKFYFLPRYEIFNDTGTTFSTGQIQTINSATLALEMRPTEDLRLQAEYRMDSSSAVPYTFASSPSPTQNVATLAAMVGF